MGCAMFGAIAKCVGIRRKTRQQSAAAWHDSSSSRTKYAFADVFAATHYYEGQFSGGTRFVFMAFNWTQFTWQPAQVSVVMEELDPDLLQAPPITYTPPPPPPPPVVFEATEVPPAIDTVTFQSMDATATDAVDNTPPPAVCSARLLPAYVHLRL
ncbi:MAG: hypothetical protein R2795_21195 [Saprospiraceae bacterium]